MQTELKPLSSWDSDLTWATFPTGRFHQEYMGLELQKCEADLERYREIVDMSQPDIVVETGTRYGASAMWFLRELGLQVVTIDVSPQFDRNGKPPWGGPGIQWIRGSSISPETVNQVIPFLSGKRVMVSLDSDHHSPHVQAEIATWGPWVTLGCYLVVEDACFEQWDPDRARVGGGRIPEFGGPQHAMVTQGLHRNPAVWRDEVVEGRSPVSHSPMGWWRKHE